MDVLMRSGRVSVRFTVAMLAMLMVLAFATNAGAATTVGGGATGLEAHVSVLGLLPVDAGPLPSVVLPQAGGGPITANLLSTNLLGLVTVDVAKVSTTGATDPGSTRSSALLANVDVAGLVTAKVAQSSCSATADTARGAAKVVDLVVAGLPIAVVDLGPNTTISTPVGSVIINEQTGAPATAPAVRRRLSPSLRRAAKRGPRARQTATRAAGPQSITVTAVRVKLNVLGLATGDVVLAQSRCSVG